MASSLRSVATSAVSHASAYLKEAGTAGSKPASGVGVSTDSATQQTPRRVAWLLGEIGDGRDFYNRAEAQIAVFEYIEDFYNGRRRHSAINYRSPREHEALYNLGNKTS